jgi:hypothetical protein
MTHYSEDELVLYYYSESGRHSTRIAAHLDECDQCRAAYADLAETLKMMPAVNAPERGEHYGLEVWQRIRPSLPTDLPAPGFWFAWRGFALAGAFAALLIAAFVAGRTWPASSPPAPQTLATTETAADPSDRVRTAAIADHLEASERLLLDFVNAGGQVVDVTHEQAAAADLVDANRLYREAAIGAGDTMVADVLDSLERNLIEIAHGPTTLSLDEFNQTRLRLDAAALLFKVRVLSEELHERETSTVPTRRET